MTGDLFTQAPTADPVAVAAKHGATFSRIEPDPCGNTWAAQAPIKRGQQFPVATFHGSSQESVATAFCNYFHHKV